MPKSRDVVIRALDNPSLSLACAAWADYGTRARTRVLNSQPTTPEQPANNTSQQRIAITAC
jgi:hypothetical protein